MSTTSPIVVNGNWQHEYQNAIMRLNPKMGLYLITKHRITTWWAACVARASGAWNSVLDRYSPLWGARYQTTTWDEIEDRLQIRRECPDQGECSVQSAVMMRHTYRCSQTRDRVTDRYSEERILVSSEPIPPVS